MGEICVLTDFRHSTLLFYIVSVKIKLHSLVGNDIFYVNERSSSFLTELSKSPRPGILLVITQGRVLPQSHGSQ